MRRVVITGMGVVSSLGLDTESTWAAALDGRCGIGPLRNLKMPGEPVQIGAEVDLPADTAIYPALGKRASFCERAGLLALEEATRQAGLNCLGVESSRVGVFQGASTSMLPPSEAYVMERNAGRRGDAAYAVNQSSSTVTDAIAHRLGATGTRSTIMNACSSSLLAMGQAWGQIAVGDLDLAAAGGAEGICMTTFAGFSSLKAMDHRPCRPFNKDRAGLNLGEGAVQFIMEPLEQALARKTEILAEVMGYGAAMDAHHPTAPHPEGIGAQLAMSMALRMAGMGPCEIDLISAHATATPANDGAECAAIRRVFGSAADRLSITATKSQFGHTLGAAGAFGAAMAVLSIRDSVVSPTLRLEERDPACDLDCTPLTPRERPIRAALVNSFAFAGNNISLILKAWGG